MLQCRHGWRWQVRATFPNGDRRSFYGRTEREAIAKKNRALDDYNAGLSRLGENMTVNALMEHWLEERTSDPEGIRPSTLAAYTSHFNFHIKPAMKGIRLRELQPVHVDKMLRKITQSGSSATTALRVRATLRAALNYAINQRWINFNAATATKKRSNSTKKKIQPLTLDQMQTLLNALVDNPMRNLVEVAVYSGLRQGELLALEWRHVDLEEGTLTVEQTLTWTKNAKGEAPRMIPNFGPPKSEESERTIHIPKPAVVALQRQQLQIVEMEREATIAGWSPVPGRDLVFPATNGAPMNSSNATNRLKAVLKDLELPHERSFHNLRHLTASLLLSRGASLFDVKEYLGHAQFTLTADTYGHMMKELSVSTASRLDDVFVYANGGKSAPIITPDTTSQADIDSGDGGEI